MRSERRWHEEDGNTLLLFPAAILVMLVLAALAIDSALVWTAQREAATLADGVARAATGAVDEDRLFDDGEYVIQLGRANAAAQGVLASRPPHAIDLRCGAPRLGPDPASVEIDCSATVQRIFARTLGGDPRFEVSVTGRARAADAPA